MRSYILKENRIRLAVSEILRCKQTHRPTNILLLLKVGLKGGTYGIATESLGANLTFEILDLLVNIPDVPSHILLPFEHKIAQRTWKFFVIFMAEFYMIS